ncbi:MAG: HD-GYP domain-containing protein [Phycisphaerales bacterium]|nr:MAG: HD-GYP domain-containing protein [Phycisphaerales bacterium]
MNTDNFGDALAEQPCGSSLWRLLSSLERLFGLSVGQVRAAGSPPKLPNVCLADCLERSPGAVETRGCAWLQAMLRDGHPPALPPDGRCQRNHQIHVPSDFGSGESGRIFALRPVQGAPPVASEVPDHRLAEVWDEALDAIERLVQQLAQREEENVRLVDEVLQSYEQLNILFEVTRASVSMSRPQEMYDFALDRLSTALRASFACFLDARGDFDRSTPRFSQQNELHDTYYRLVSTEARAALHQAITVGAAQALEFKTRPTRASLLIVPLISGTESLGAALFGRPLTDTFRTGDCSMAEAVMGQVAITAHKMRLFQDLQQMSFDVVGALVNAIDAKDDYTGGHSDRVARWSVMLGEALDMGEDDLQMLAWAGRLHDVGKIGVRDDVLGKPGRLTPEEFEHIKLHPAISYEVLKPIRRLAHVLNGVRHHHEAWDGSGYPDGLAGEQIPLEARIIQTADVFDALTSSRSYREAFTLEKALDIMQAGAGEKFDPDLVSLLVSMMERARTEHPDLFERIPQDPRDRDVDVGGSRP